MSTVQIKQGHSIQVYEVTNLFSFKPEVKKKMSKKIEYKSDKFIHHRLVTMCCEDARRSALPSHPLIDQQAWY